MQQLALGIELQAAANFDNFYAGANQEVLVAMRAERIGPLWIWGATATGKTHLLQAACVANPQPSAYMPLRSNLQLPPQALLGLEALSLSCIDDADSIAGNDAWEQALFHFFNAATESRSRLIFAARVPPSAVPWRLADFASRASSCTVYQLRALDDESRLQALRLRAAARGIELPKETAQYVLKRTPRDQQALFALIDTLDKASLVAQRRLTVPFVRAALNFD